MWSLATPMALLLLPAPYFAWRFLPVLQERNGFIFVPSSIASAADEPLPGLIGVKVRKIIPALIWFLLILGLAGPRIVELKDVASASGRDIVLALDLSGSMERQDFTLDGKAISRLDAVKRVGASFVRGRKGDRLAVVIFADRAYFAAPLTFDVETVARSIEQAAIGISGRSTALGDGLGLAIKRLAKSKARSRVIILLSDGVDTAGTVDAVKVGALAQEKGLRIYTIALGPQDLETTPEARDAVDSATLRQIAESSGGETFRVRTLTDLSAVATALDGLEPSPSQRPPLEIHKDYWIIPAIMALLLTFALIVDGRREA